MLLRSICFNVVVIVEVVFAKISSACGKEFDLTVALTNVLMVMCGRISILFLLLGGKVFRHPRTIPLWRIL